MKNLDMNKSV